jgi:phosphatidylglycerophosphatase A
MGGRLILTCISFLGTGLISRKMPGTVGSFFGSILMILIPSQLILYFFIITFLIGWLGCFLFFKQNKSCEDKDPGFIVIDEVCGIFCCGTFLVLMNHACLYDFAVSFVLFRFFDILKPWPIRCVESYCEKKMAATGIMIDDILAAIYAMFVQAIYIYLVA